MKTMIVKPKQVKRNWVLIDAQGKRLGRVAAQAAHMLRGKHKPEFTPNFEIGDYVIIINAEKAELSGNKVNDKIYYRHSQYPSGLKEEPYCDMVCRKPTFPMEQAVKGMLPKGPLGRQLFRNLKVYAGSVHPHEAQQPQVLDI